jgi:OPT family oligopeptide transporter
MLCWVFFLAVLGVTMAIPMKRQMVNIEQLRFPSGIAAAETLRVLHSHGERAARSARALGIACVVAAIDKFWHDGTQLIGAAIDRFRNDATQLMAKAFEACSSSALLDRFNNGVFGQYWINRTVNFEWDPIFLAAGALTGLRASASMLLGGTLCWAVFVPVLQNRGYIPLELDPDTAFRDIVLWTLWGGVACMVTSGLLSVCFQWRSVLRAFGSLRKLYSGEKGRRSSEMDAIEVPASWFIGGQLVGLIGLATLAEVSFGMHLWQSVLAVLLTFVLALVACRVTGETDTTPIGAMGKVTQLLFGALSPGNTDVNLMSANITAGAAGSAADLLTDLKSGYLLGANPRKQFLAQFSGIFIGTVVTVFCFNALVKDGSILATKQFPAPSAVTWKAVAEVMSKGLSELAPLKAWSMLAGGLVGIILPLLAKLFPKQEKWVPSAAGIGLAWTFPWYSSLLFFLGAVMGHAVEKRSPKYAEEYTYPVASGIIAGGSLVGAILKLF